MYGHLDKEPPTTGWKKNTGNTIPLVEEGRLYGRGAVDDGYSVLAMALAIQTCQE
jgi:acetylornithine deacetylase/succinyl-diaminopimelate desuccinylase-like protein